MNRVQKESIALPYEIPLWLKSLKAGQRVSYFVVLTKTSSLERLVTGMPDGSGRFIRTGGMKKELPAGTIKSGIKPSMKKPSRLKA